MRTHRADRHFSMTSLIEDGENDMYILKFSKPGLEDVAKSLKCDSLSGCSWWYKWRLGNKHITHQVPNGKIQLHFKKQSKLFSNVSTVKTLCKRWNWWFITGFHLRITIYLSFLFSECHFSSAYAAKTVLLSSGCHRRFGWSRRFLGKFWLWCRRRLGRWFGRWNKRFGQRVLRL